MVLETVKFKTARSVYESKDYSVSFRAASKLPGMQSGTCPY